MEQTIVWIMEHPETSLVVACTFICNLLTISYVQYSSRKLELLARVLIEGHASYYREITPAESGAFSETDSYKQYWHDQHSK